MSTRRRFSEEFKAKVTLEALKGGEDDPGDRHAAQGASESGERVEAAGSGGDERSLLEGGGAGAWGPRDGDTEVVPENRTGC